jgi:glycosyltransferase involved in cell wall biosynthesis
VAAVVEVQTQKIGIVEIDLQQLGAPAKPSIVVGIPAFNEEKTIAKVILRSQKYADKIVVCDDGGSDLTGEISRRLGAEVVRHETNLGYGAAIQTLFERAKELGADVLVTLDADGQHDPEDIPNVVKPIIEGSADIAVGSRFTDVRSSSVIPWHRKAGIKLISRIVENSTKQGVADAQSGLRAYGSKSLDKLTMAEKGMGVSVEILMNARKQGLRVQEVPATCDYGSELKKHVHNPVMHGADVIMSIIRLIVEDRPLSVLGIPAIVCLGGGVFFGVWMLQIYGAEHYIVTNIALASLAFVLIGFFLLSTSITLYAIARLAQRTNAKR